MLLIEISVFGNPVLHAFCVIDFFQIKEILNSERLDL